MPEPPATDFFTRFVLENPWPAGLVLSAIAAVLGWLGLREGLKNRVRVAFVLAIVGAGVIAIGLLVTTAGEHGRRVTRALVDAVVSEDVVSSMALFSDDAVMNSGSPNNPGLGIGTISTGSGATSRMNSPRISFMSRQPGLVFDLKSGYGWTPLRRYISDRNLGDAS